MATVETETHSPVEIARHIFEDVLNQRDADAVRSYWADDLVEELPTGTYNGPDEMALYFAEIFAALPDFRRGARPARGRAPTTRPPDRPGRTRSGGTTTTRAPRRLLSLRPRRQRRRA